MATRSDSCNGNGDSRRSFLKTTSVLAATGTLAGGLPIARAAHVGGGDALRIGLIGCGGRGRGAALNALKADKNCKLVAMADAFDDRLQFSLNFLAKQAEKAFQTTDRVAVDADHRFVGFEAGRQLIDSGVDVVLLVEPPHFRPAHLKAAIDAGKHVFSEKPVAVDSPGARSVLESVQAAKQKGLSLAAGLCWRYDPATRETMKRIHDGAIGRIRCIQENYLAGPLGHRPRLPEQTEFEHQLRNWQYFVWLCGDFNVEQHVHSLDKAAWAMRDEPPAKAWGMGGRLRRDPTQGDVYDHHAVVYEYADGTPVHAYCRQISGCDVDVSDTFFGTKGTAYLYGNPRIEGENPWHYEGPRPGSGMYDQEHKELFASIRSGKPINDGDYLAKSTMWAILGRMTDYLGKPLTWEKALGSQQDFTLPRYAFDVAPPTVPDADGKYPIPLPGLTKFI
ncbi:MAG: Gfo/Idh/MocA family oxidoreductase [Pirellulales bacterium]|nr:Gfo/Idh/MocA family oxidoreductase [Pirellulales bacterium]